MKKYPKYLVGGAGALLIFSGAMSFDFSIINPTLYTLQMPLLGTLQLLAGVILLIIAARMGGEDSVS